MDSKVLAHQFGETYATAASAGYYDMCEWLLNMWKEHGPGVVVTIQQRQEDPEWFSK